MNITLSLKKLSITICFFLISFAHVNAQDISEEKKVESVIKNYIENFFTNNYDKMEVSLHDRLSKRGVNQQGKLSDEYPKEALKKLMETQRAFPLKYQKNVISDIKINNRVATAIMETGYPKTRWMEYIHLAKLDGKWIITDVFWCFNKIND